MNLKPVLAIALLLAGCTEAPRAAEDVIITDFAEAPPGARPGACYGRDATPATIERVTERVLVEAAKIGPEGNVIRPAKYETRSTQRIVEGREEVYFETPCPPRWTPDFIASVQRALAARGYFKGPADGQLDSKTRAAIRAFQLTKGLNSAILSTENARVLGLVEVDLPD